MTTRSKRVSVLALRVGNDVGVADSSGLRQVWRLQSLAASHHDGARQLALMAKVCDRVKATKYDVVAIDSPFGLLCQEPSRELHWMLNSIILCACSISQVKTRVIDPRKAFALNCGLANPESTHLLERTRVNGESISCVEIAGAYSILEQCKKELRSAAIED